MKEKITTGTNDRPKNETIGQSGSGLPDDSGSIIEVSDDQVEAVRAKLGLSESSEDRSPARRKDQDRPATDSGADAPGAEEIAGAGAEEDTYD
ncbi:hypothetical protein [Tianweitania sp.]|uniref:hypothetical protein n=1 Tax=Tianweitania sp. TaxID=2021634 RepID=UPI00289ED094|nr:hypothetical protein [Tianweitania sp.]